MGGIGKYIQIINAICTNFILNTGTNTLDRYFKDYLYCYIGVMYHIILYIIQYQVHVPDEVVANLQDHKTFGASGSVIEDLVSHLYHDDPSYKSDNASAYSFL